MGPGPGVVIGSMFFKDFCRIFYARNVSETEKQCLQLRNLESEKYFQFFDRLGKPAESQG